MKFPRMAVLLIAATAVPAFGCGSKAGAPERHAAAQAPETAPPTPDTTPVEVLRTPAGLVLKLGETPPAVTPAPSPSPAAGKPAA